jgi:hypothetical protein
MTDYTVQIVDDYVAPTTPLATNAEYVNFVMNLAGQSYAHQYNTATSEDGITAAREAFNAALPVAEEPVAEEPVVEEPVAEEPVAEEPVVEEPVEA